MEHDRHPTTHAIGFVISSSKKRSARKESSVISLDPLLLAILEQSGYTAVDLLHFLETLMEYVNVF